MSYDGDRLRWFNRRIHTTNVIFGEVLYEPGGTCGPRIQRHFELVVFHSGDCQAQLQEGLCHLTVGQVYFLRPGRREYFCFSTDRETHHSYCSIEPAFIPGEMKRRLERAPAAAPQSETFKFLLGATFKLRTPRNPATQRVIDRLGLCLFEEYLNSAANAAATAAGDPVVRRFVEYMDDHFAEERCLQNACREAGVSRNTLIQRFRAERHTTPARFLWRLRAERGVALLIESGHTVAEIAYRCGFKDPFHFSRVIRRLFGRPPREIRAQAWSQGAADDVTKK